MSDIKKVSKKAAPKEDKTKSKTPEAEPEDQEPKKKRKRSGEAKATKAVKDKSSEAKEAPKEAPKAKAKAASKTKPEKKSKEAHKKTDDDEEVEEVEDDEEVEEVAPTTKKTGGKGKGTVFDRLSPERRKEVAHVARRVAQNNVITPAFITSALRLAKQSERRIRMLPEFRERLHKQYEVLMNKCGDDNEKKAKLQTQLTKKLERIARIEKSFMDGAQLAFKAGDTVFLGRIRLVKPLSGYMLYAKENRDVVQQADTSASFGQIGRLIGTEWKKLTEAEKDSWKHKALDAHVAEGGTLPEPPKKRVKKSAQDVVTEVQAVDQMDTAL
jgi:hypothetical protein